MIAVDTNLLVHAHQRESDLHERAKVVLRNLAESPAPWAVCFHSLIEFYAVATHPRLWRQASSPAQAVDQITAWRESPSLRVLIDNDACLDRLAHLAEKARIRGPQIHDARIAACCLTFG
ncbi:MAG: PIN domain-containing protein, partial [Kiritimatiellae bacterium]|nr:PIN domain-containing protein [Kiritimatiellia bacterium]